MGIPVYLSSGNLDAPIIAAVMASICSNTKSDVNFYIIDGFLTYYNKQKIIGLKKFFKNFTIQFIRLNLKPWLEKYPELSKLDKGILIKYLMPTLIDDLDKAFLIEKDILFLKGGNIEELFKTDLQGFIMAAVPLATMLADGLWNRKRLANISKIGLSSIEAVFDPGMILVDVKKWNQENTTDKLFNITKELVNAHKFFDCYDGLFKLLDGHYLKLNKSWNVPYHYAQMFYIGKKFSQEDMRILHFNYTGENKKPWNNKELDGACYFWKYAELTLYKDYLLQNPPSRIHDPTYWAKLKFRRKIINLIIKCLVSRKRYKKLKTHTDQFFADSKSKVIRYLGKLYF